MNIVQFAIVPPTHVHEKGQLSCVRNCVSTRIIVLDSRGRLLISTVPEDERQGLSFKLLDLEGLNV